MYDKKEPVSFESSIVGLWAYLVGDSETPKEREDFFESTIDDYISNRDAQNFSGRKVG